MPTYFQQNNPMTHTIDMFDGVNNGIGGSNSGSSDTDSWFVSYADILLLLLTFFVLLFAFSRVDGASNNEQIVSDLDKVMATPIEKTESVEILVTDVSTKDLTLNVRQQPLVATTAEMSSEISHVTAIIGEGSVTIVHELIAQVDDVTSHDGIKIDALFDETSQSIGAEVQTSHVKTAVAVPQEHETIIAVDESSDNSIEQVSGVVTDIAMYDVVQENGLIINQSPTSKLIGAIPINATHRESPNILVKANLVALTVDEQLAKLSAGLTSSEVEISNGYQSINIELNNKILFPLGEAQLLEEGQVFLNEIVTIMASNEYFASVEGHTDNTPIATPKFPSNWELSSSRATSVARYLISQGVASNRLRAIGYADTKPKVDNGSLENRARNRRVSITFHYDSDAPLS